MRRSIELTVDGERISLELVHVPSRGGARRILCIHGNPSHLEHFAPVLPCLARLGEVVAFDLPGYGRTPPPRHPPSLDWNADVTAALARSLWPDGDVDLVGQSFGGGVALTVLARHPALARSAVLLGSIGYPAHDSLSDGARLARVVGALRAARWAGHLVGWAPFALGPFARPSFDPDPFPPGFLAREARLIAARPWILSTSLAANLGEPCEQLARRAATIERPVLFVHGREDQLVPVANARALYDAVARSAPGSRFESVAGGHMVHFTHPDRVCPLLEEWLR